MVTAAPDIRHDIAVTVFGMPGPAVPVLRRAVRHSSVGKAREQRDLSSELFRKPYVVAVNVTGMIRSEALIPPAQGEYELEMLRVIQQSGWKGPIGLIAEQGGDAEVTLSNGLEGLKWLGKELTKPGSGGERPKVR